MRKVMFIGTLVLTCVLLLGLLAGTALANPTYFSQIPDGYKKDCTLCHTSPPTLNDFGKQFKAAGFDFKKLAPAAPAAPAAKPAAPAAPAVKPAAPAAPAAKPAVAPAAKPAPKKVVPKLPEVKVTLGNDKISQEVAAVVVDEQIMIPVRAAADLLGSSVAWDNKAKVATIKVGGNDVVMNIGKGKIKVGDNEFPAVTKIYQNRAYIALVTLGERLDTQFSVKFAKIEDASKLKSAIVNAKWSQSAHATPVASPVSRDTCVACHNGDGFDQGVTKVADLKNVDPKDPKGQYCTTCHGVRGKEIRNGGVVKLASNGVTVNAGRGALCMSCHNSRRNNLDVEAAFKGKSAPHRGPQADVLTATGGMEFAGHIYPSSPHNANPNTCVSCHMAKDENGIANHTYDVNQVLPCGSCHAGLTTVNRTALGDYDGDKTVEGIQDEVEGLVHMVQQAIKDKTGATMGESHGAFVFTDANGKEIDVPIEVYKAAWNVGIIEADGSEGVHNPAYVVALLQQSYKALTGKDVPNARIR